MRSLGAFCGHRRATEGFRQWRDQLRALQERDGIGKGRVLRYKRKATRMATSEVTKNEEQLKTLGTRRLRGHNTVPFKYFKGLNLKRDLSFPVRTQMEIKELD